MSNHYFPTLLSWFNPICLVRDWHNPSIHTRRLSKLYMIWYSIWRSEVWSIPSQSLSCTQPIMAIQWNFQRNLSTGLLLYEVIFEEHLFPGKVQLLCRTERSIVGWSNHSEAPGKVKRLILGTRRGKNSFLKSVAILINNKYCIDLLGWSTPVTDSTSDDIGDQQDYGEALI